MSYPWYVVLVGLVAVERLAELAITRRNLVWSRARGGYEVGSGHYGPLVVLHVGLLVGCLVEPVATGRSFVPWLGWPMFALVLAAQSLRWWCIRTLGRQWTTRIVVIPGLSRVSAGPYRRVAHPNYVAVVVEGLALPLVYGAWLTALCFAVANGVMLRVRIRAEDRALADVYG